MQREKARKISRLSRITLALAVLPALFVSGCPIYAEERDTMCAPGYDYDRPHDLCVLEVADDVPVRCSTSRDCPAGQVCDPFLRCRPAPGSSGGTGGNGGESGESAGGPSEPASGSGGETPTSGTGGEPNEPASGAGGEPGGGTGNTPSASGAGGEPSEPASGAGGEPNGSEAGAGGQSAT